MYKIIINGRKSLKDVAEVENILKDGGKTLMNAGNGNPVTAISQMNTNDEYMVSKAATGNN